MEEQTHTLAEPGTEPAPGVVDPAEPNEESEKPKYDGGEIPPAAPSEDPVAPPEQDDN